MVILGAAATVGSIFGMHRYVLCSPIINTLFPLPLGRGVLATPPLQMITNQSRAVLFSLSVFVQPETFFHGT